MYVRVMAASPWFIYGYSFNHDITAPRPPAIRRRPAPLAYCRKPGAVGRHGQPVRSPAGLIVRPRRGRWPRVGRQWCPHNGRRACRPEIADNRNGGSGGGNGRDSGLSRSVAA